MCHQPHGSILELAQTHELANIQIQKAGLGPDPHQQKHLPASDLERQPY